MTKKSEAYQLYKIKIKLYLNENYPYLDDHSINTLSKLAWKELSENSKQIWIDLLEFDNFISEGYGVRK